MSQVDLIIQEPKNVGTEPVVIFILKDEEQEVWRRDARVFEEEDMIAVSDEVSRLSKLNQAEIDQGIAELIEPIRHKWLRSREQQGGDNLAKGSQTVQPRYVAILPSQEEGGNGEASIRDAVKERSLTNFVLILDEDVEVQDDHESGREFVGKLTIQGRTVPFRIAAKDYADSGKLKAALFSAGGCGVVVLCSMDELRTAISKISEQSGQIRHRKATTNFGWTSDRSAYLTPSCRISREGIEVVNDGSDVRVDLASETPACCLDLKKLDPRELIRVKQHIVEDLLKLNDPVVTHTLLGATAAAVLYPFTKGAGRFALWLVGRTGVGKSFVVKLFSNFFGDFPVSSAPFTTWSATANYAQRQGYFFKDAVYLVDDYKPEVVPMHQVVRVLQTYADNAARGRLKADATANVPRPIRGLLVCTGEDVPEHNASAIARSVIVKVPQKEKRVDAGTRCLAECQNYSGVMADFIRWLLAEDRIRVFKGRFEELQQRFYTDVAGQQNDIRVASNLALLGAAYEQFAEYLGDVWAEWREVARKYVEEDLVAIRAEMLGAAKEQQASEVFLRTLGDLIQHGHVRIEGFVDGLPGNTDNRPLIGHMTGSRNGYPRGPATRQDQERFEISMSLALAEVNKCLRQQAKPELRNTIPALLEQLREDGKLVDQHGQTLAEDADPTRRIRLKGVERQQRVFTISRRELLGTDEVAG